MRKIAKQYGIAAVAKLIVDENDAHRVSEAELMQLAGEYATGKTLGKLLSAKSEEGAPSCLKLQRSVAKSRMRGKHSAISS